MHFTVCQQAQIPWGQVDQKTFEPSHKLLLPTTVPLLCVWFSAVPVFWILANDAADCGREKHEMPKHTNSSLQCKEVKKKSQQWSFSFLAHLVPPSPSLVRRSTIRPRCFVPWSKLSKYTHVRQPGRALDRLARHYEVSLNNPRQSAYIGPWAIRARQQPRNK